MRIEKTFIFLSTAVCLVVFAAVGFIIIACNPADLFVLILCLAGALVLALFSSLVFAKLVKRPLAGLKNYASAIAQGDPEAVPPEPLGMELEELRISLLSLAKKLQEIIQESDRQKQELQRAIAEREPARSESGHCDEQYQSIFENALEGLYRSTPEGRFITANSALARMLGYETPEELMAGVTDIGTQVYHEAADRKALLEMLLEKDKVMRFETRFQRKDGSLFWASLSVRTLRGRNGALIYEGAAMDVDERKIMERTLEKAKNEAENLSDLKSEFLSLVSHEMRTPLTSILGYVKIAGKKLRGIMDQEYDPERLQSTCARLISNLDVVQGEAERLTDIITDVLDLALIESQRMEWRMRTTRVEDILNAAMQSMQSRFQEKDLETAVEVEPNLPDLVCDRERIIQVVVNLLSNAEKFTETGRVTCRAEARGGDVVFSVEDTGIGVPPGREKAIFDKFSQFSDTDTGKPRGTGLGLSISSEIVHRHGGRIWMERSSHGGSIFNFSLPVESESLSEVFVRG